MDARQLIFPSFRFGSDDPALAERLTRLGVGGFCLYGGTAAAVAAFTRRLQRLAPLPLLFCGDYEDGTASHVRGGTRFPSNMALGASGRADLARLKGLLTAREALALGVRWVLAPVLDLAERADNPIVNVRSFGAEPGLVARLGAAYLAGLRAGGALSCVKHFPGHGGTAGDSHLGLPSLSASRARLMRRDLAPFARTLRSADAVMTAHLRAPALGTGRLPASLSPAIGRLIRGRLRFAGLVATDALDMRAVAGRLPEAEAAVRALAAGADVLLVPKDPLALARTLPARLEGATARAALAALERLERAKRAAGLLRDGGLPKGGLGLVGCRAHREAAERMAAAALTALGRGGPPRRVAYVEASEGGRAGAAFRRELARLGIPVRAGRAGPEETPVAASFLRPRAYSGRIRHEPAQLRRLRAALAVPGSVLAAFGSPFVLDEARGWSRALCAFSADEASQRAAARALAGKAPARGRMPVRLERG